MSCQSDLTKPSHNSVRLSSMPVGASLYDQFYNRQLLSITSVDIRLIGIKSGDNGKFYKNVSVSDLKKLNNGNYRVIFDANSATGGLLPNSLSPQSIVVTPVTEEPRPVKAVTGQNKLEGGFYAELIVYTSTSQTPAFSSRNLRVIPIYTSCSLNGIANPLKL